MARPPARHTPYEHEGRCSNGCRSVNKGYWNGGSGTSANHSEAEEKGAFDSELAERTAAPNGDCLTIFQIAKSAAIGRHSRRRPYPVALPMRAEISWMAAINRNR